MGSVMVGVRLRCRSAYYKACANVKCPSDNQMLAVENHFRHVSNKVLQSVKVR